MQTISVLLTCVVVVLLWVFWIRHWHIGTGMFLYYRHFSERVYVECRLIKSPSGDAGVENGDRLIAVDGQILDFQNAFEFTDWQKRHPLVLGKKNIYQLESVDGAEKIVEIIPRWILTEVPSYPRIENDLLSQIRDSGDIEIGLRYCPKTGIYYRTFTPSIRTLRNITRWPM